MNVIERLAKAAKVNHGLQLEPRNVKEIITIIQGMQFQIASDTGRMDALTRILAVSLNQVGGSLDIESELFSEAEHYAIDVQWDTEEEGAIIHVRLTKSTDVEVPEVPEDRKAADGGGSNLMPVSVGDGGREVPSVQDDPDERG